MFHKTGNALPKFSLHRLLRDNLYLLANVRLEMIKICALILKSLVDTTIDIYIDFILILLLLVFKLNCKIKSLKVKIKELLNNYSR